MKCRLRSFAPIVGAMLMAGGTCQALAEALAFTPPIIRAAELQQHIETLASDDYEGRAPGSRGEQLTLDYLTTQCRRLGLEPASRDGTFLQSVPLVGIVGKIQTSFSAKGEPLTLEAGSDFVVRSYRQSATTSSGHTDVVFVGYGIVAPEFGWDDLKSADLVGKTAVVLDGEPGAASAVDFFQGDVRTYYSTVASKSETLRRRGAIAVFVLYRASNATTSLAALKNNYALESFALKALPNEPPPALVEGRLTQAAFARLCAAAGENAETLRTAAEEKTFSPVSLAATASFEVVTALREVTSHNLVAKITGRDATSRDEVIVYTAHWDHLGKTEALSGDTIFNGAIDNAAGVAQLLGVASAFASASQAPKRTVLFVFTTAEEKGYLGARHYVREPLFPLSRTVAAINLDSGNVWGRTLDMVNLGFGLTTLDELLERAAAGQGRRFVREPFAAGGYFFASDQIEFAKAGVPAIFPSPGSEFRDRPAGFGDQKWGEYGEKDYHQVTDAVRADWDYSGLVEDAQWLWAVGNHLAESRDVPEWRTGAGFHRAK